MVHVDALSSRFATNLSLRNVHQCPMTSSFIYSTKQSLVLKTNMLEEPMIISTNNYGSHRETVNLIHICSFNRQYMLVSIFGLI